MPFKLSSGKLKENVGSFSTNRLIFLDSTFLPFTLVLKKDVKDHIFHLSCDSVRILICLSFWHGEHPLNSMNVNIVFKSNPVYISKLAIKMTISFDKSFIGNPFLFPYRNRCWKSIIVLLPIIRNYRTSEVQESSFFLAIIPSIVSVLFLCCYSEARYETGSYTKDVSNLIWRKL